METRTDVFAESRPWLFAIAYRMLGSVMDAEDVVQDAWLRWQEAPETEVRSPRAYLTTIVTRLAINRLQSARAQRETYVGPWLPEPLVTDPEPDPEAKVELAESLSMAFLVLLERLSPVERAVFLLHEVFDLEYPEIARIVDKTEANCRQLVVRAKQHVAAPRARFEADKAQANRLVQRFIEAGQAGDLNGLLAILAEDITLYGDAGGKLPGAARKPIHGAAAVAGGALAFARRLAPAGVTLRQAVINGQPGIIAYVSGKTYSALIFDIRDGRIRTLYAISNPDKLGRLPALPT
jgi:RNA polymerase sigma-70 factor, ECF subfamily